MQLEFNLFIFFGLQMGHRTFKGIDQFWKRPPLKK